MSNESSILLVFQPLLDEYRHLHAAFFHRSARSKAVEYLSDHGNDTTILDSWESFGKATLSLYACRLTLNLPMKKSAAICSLALSGISKQLLNQFASSVRISALSKFGSGVTLEELDKDESYHGIVFQLIGAVTHIRGYRFSSSEVLDTLFNIPPLKIPAGKDSKTTLQEYTQRRFKSTPKYTVVDSSGPAHAMIFKVTMEMNGQSFLGKGPSVRLAEHDSAIAYMKKNNIVWQKDISVNLQVDIDYCSEIKKMTQARSGAASLASLLESYMLPAWAEPLFALSLTHRSFRKNIKDGLLGQDNTLLAFVGAHLIQWIAHDTVLGSLSNEEVSRAGGISIVVPLLVSNHQLESIFHDLFSINMIKVGSGEKVIKPAMKSEFTQAFCGALFLVREVELANSKNFFYGIAVLKEYFYGNSNRLRVSRDESLPAKTVLQELCQSLAIKIQFETKTEVLDYRAKYITPYIYLQSDFLLEKLCIQGVRELEENHLRQKNSRVESNLAFFVRQNIEAFFGCVRDINSESNLDKWMLSFVSVYSESFASNRNFNRNKKLVAANFLGAAFLKRKEFFEYEAWYSSLFLKFKEQKVDFSKAIKNSFYEYAGQISGKSYFEEGIVGYLLSLEAALTVSDPLAENSDLLISDEYRGLVDHAAAYKIRAGYKSKVNLSDIVAQFFLLSRRSDRVKLLADVGLEVLEIQGCHLAMLDLLVNLRPQFPSVEVEITDDSGLLVYTFIKAVDDPKPYLPELENRSIWRALKILMPVTNLKEVSDRLVIVVPALVKSQVRIESLYSWWSFVLQGTSSVAANDMIAAMLHSLKNDILGYSVSSLQARAQQSNRARYQFATDASNHIEKALVTLRAVRSLSNDTVKPEISLVSIETFFRGLLSSLWSWIPESVTLDFTGVDSGVELFTSKDSLYSIFVNLVKNSVEALGGCGTISIACSLDRENEGLEVLVSDSGDGFTDSQLNELNSGTPVSSSKRNGHGLGLLTVILLTKELNGNLIFYNGERQGANIKVWIPSFSSAEE